MRRSVRRSRRNAHQDTMCDPFEGYGSGWEALDAIAEDYTWAACDPGTTAKRGPRARAASRRFV